jgi:hypothetical protein
MISAAQKAPETYAAQLELVLQLAQDERRRRHSPQWKMDMESAINAHADAVDRLYAELYRLLDDRASAGNPVHPSEAPPDLKKELRKQIVTRLKEAIPGMIDEVLDEF